MRALAACGERPKRPLAHARGSVKQHALAVILCAVALGLLAGCGQIGEPLYPALRIPMHVTGLIVVEQGNNLDIDFTIPPQTTEGLPLKEIGGVELRVGPGPSNGWNADEWAKSSTRIDVPTPATPGPVHATVSASKFIGNEVVVAVKVSNPNGRDAGWSDTKIFDVKPPLADPTNFHVVADPKGVALTWSASGPSQFRIFRKAEQQQRPILLATATEPNYVDISAEFGKSYQYSIQAVRDNIESNIVGPETITPINEFPPAVPSGLTASIGIGAVELAWNRNTESNFNEYRVLRSEQGGPFVEIAHGLDAPIYSDHNIQSGKRYLYEVVAVAQNGHTSAPCEPVVIIAP
jgi:hypothetical protein